MEEKIVQFTEDFFKNLGCDLNWEGDMLLVRNVPKSFEDLFGKKSPYRFSFKNQIPGVDFVGVGSSLWTAMNRYLDGIGKTTILKIDFDIDVEKELNNFILLKNCRIERISKKYRNLFFTRFTFATLFNYLNEGEKMLNEIYVYDGKIVKGDLRGYNVLEGEIADFPKEKIKKDYLVAKRFLSSILEKRKKELGEILEGKLELEVNKLEEHYENLFSELGGDLNERIEKIQDLEEKMMRVESEEEFNNLKIKMERLKNSLVRIGDDGAKERILREQKIAMQNLMQKYSLNVSNKLINTTVIYYPLIVLEIFLRGDNTGRYLELSYDPLKKELEQLFCESCNQPIHNLNLCSAGHIVCDSCINSCSDCGRPFCKNCLNKSCSVCGKSLCKNCVRVCNGCGKYVCEDHLRVDCVSGEERCVNCLKACLRCHNLAQPKNFGISSDGSKICLKCLGVERREKVLKEIFPD